MLEEINEIKIKYENGQLNGIKSDLEEFIRKNKEDIKRFKVDKEIINKLETVSDDIAVKLFILKMRSINPAREIKEQLEEINKEKWIRGVRDGKPPSPQEVALEWAKLYSRGWRDHRILSAIYVFEREKDRYLNLLYQ